MKIIQITDTHLMPSGIIVNGVDPERQLRAAIADIVEKHSDADLGVMTGDLCNFGDPEAYALLKDILAPVPFEMRLLLGNHDDRANFRNAFPDHPVDENGFVQSHLDTPFGRLLFLDSHAAGVIGGHYGEDRMAWLDSALAGAGGEPVTVFIHHPPMDCGIAHFARIGMHDEGRLMQRLAAHAAVSAISSSAISMCRSPARVRKASPSVPARPAPTGSSPISMRPIRSGPAAIRATAS